MLLISDMKASVVIALYTHLFIRQYRELQHVVLQVSKD